MVVFRMYKHEHDHLDGFLDTQKKLVANEMKERWVKSAKNIRNSENFLQSEEDIKESMGENIIK